MDVVTVAPAATDLILRRHDPVVHRRPAPRPGAVADDARCAALTWNVFQTLALIEPAFWLRRLRARMVGLRPDDPVPQTATVSLWAHAGQDVVADVLIDTDTAVYGFLTLFQRDLPLDLQAASGPDAMLRLIEAVSCRAGVRDCYVGVVTSHPDHSPVAVAQADRYALSREALVRRLPARRDRFGNVRGVGRMTWGDLLAVLHDCSAAHVLDDFERFAATRTAAWVEATGITRAR